VTEQPIRFWRLQEMAFGPRELETKLEAMTSPTPAKIQHAGFTDVRVMVRLCDTRSAVVEAATRHWYWATLKAESVMVHRSAWA